MIRVLVTEIMLLNNLFRTCGCFTQRNQHQHTNFDCCLPCILGADFNFPPSGWHESSSHGGSHWIHTLDVLVVVPVASTHKRKAGTGHTSGIIHYFLVSKPICPLVQECDVLRTVQWSPHYGFCITLNIDYTAQGETPQHGFGTPVKALSNPKVRTQLAGKRHHADAYSTETNPAVILDRKTPAARAPIRQT